ncbi:MAG: Type 1 glutamine amidotransferase-like domain-containing protein [Ruminococcus sp.]|nr:Type 1 glutamine amidotransferase-like domain-containing protein [Ruminococcus sp.]
MLILGSCGFSNTAVRIKISELVADKSGKMLIVPLACFFGTETGEKERRCASMAGFIKENIYVFDEDKPEELLGMKFDYIAVLGGNTLKLLKLVRKYHLDAFIKEQVADGAVYIGFSAGAYLACNDIGYVTNYDPNTGYITDGNFHALRLTEKYVLCHFDTRGEEDIKMCRQYIGEEAELVTINNNQLIVIE